MSTIQSVQFKLLNQSHWVAVYVKNGLATYVDRFGH